MGLKHAVLLNDGWVLCGDSFVVIQSCTQNEQKIRKYYKAIDPEHLHRLYIYVQYRNISLYYLSHSSLSFQSKQDITNLFEVFTQGFPHLINNFLDVFKLRLKKVIHQSLNNKGCVE